MDCGSETELKDLLREHMNKSQDRHDELLQWKAHIERRFGEQQLLEYRIISVEASLEKMANSISSLSDTVNKLAKIEITQNEINVHLEKSAKTVERAFKAIEEGDAEIKALVKDHEDRIRVVESDMPTVRLARNWAFSGIVAVITAVGAATLALVVK